MADAEEESRDPDNLLAKVVFLGGGGNMGITKNSASKIHVDVLGFILIDGNSSGLCFHKKNIL